MEEKPKHLLYIILFISLLISSQSSAENWEKLFERAQYNNAKISPDGKHLAVLFTHKGKNTLAFLDRETMSPVGTALLRGKNEVGDYHWVNNERVVGKIVQRHAFLEKPQYYGELFAINLTGQKYELIYGYRSGEMQTGSKIKKKKSIYGWAEIIDVLPEDNKHILISSTKMTKSGESFPTALILNVYTGVIQRTLMRSPIPKATFITDLSGEIKAVGGKNTSQLFIRKGSNWIQVPKTNIGKNAYPIAIDSSGKYLYTLDNFKQDLTGLFKLNLNDLSYKSVFTDKDIDISDVMLSTNGRTAYALRLDNGYPEYILLNKTLQESKTFKDLLASFPYHSVQITSQSYDENFYIVKVSSDINPGSLYLFNKIKNKLELLFELQPNVPTEKLKEIEPIKIKASDGMTINGYFTNATKSDAETPAPLVILVHGGPHFVRDYWGYSNYVQYLALNGFSVLQVNYRGSHGYGSKFERAGFKHWGTNIQQDIYDSYQWLIKQNKASKNNACIMGGSFGAYSAIQSSIMFPNTYKCAIANAGVYDLPLMFEEGDITDSQSGKLYLEDTLGKDKKILKAMSPVYNVDNLSTPLLLAHGKKDKRAPFEHALRLKDALDKNNKNYEWYVIEKEGHGFYNSKNQQEYMRKVLSFLQKHLH